MDIENIMRAASSTATGRDALAKFIMAADSLYIPKLLPLVEMAEDLEDIDDLHRLCNIMKTLILLNDTAIIEFVVSDQAILGVVGALECAYPAISLVFFKVTFSFFHADMIPQTTPTSQVTKQITANSLQTSPSFEKWSRLRIRRSKGRFITYIASNTSRTLCWPGSWTIPPFPS